MPPAIIRFTPAVKFILILNFLTYLVQLTTKYLWNSYLIESSLALVGRWDCGWQLWRFLSYAFLHNSVWSLLWLILALLFLGPSVEECIGKLKFLCVYFGSVFVGGLAAYTVGLWLKSSPEVLLIGSSAGILGIFAYFARLNPEITLNVWLLVLIPIKAIALWWFTAICLVMLMLSNLAASGYWQADLGGFVFGSTALMWLPRIELKRSLTTWYRRWKIWGIRRLGRLNCLRSSDSTILNNSSLNRTNCGHLKVVSSKNGEIVKNAINPTVSNQNLKSSDELKLDALMDKLISKGEKYLTAEERSFLKSKSKRS
ncbi:MAG: rhomboid family intramembrane serine protease [Candidatus Bruticola sp.]